MYKLELRDPINYYFQMPTLQIHPTVIGIIVILLGLSFAYRAVRAFVFGKINYWAGFAPISIISPLLIHTPPPPSPPPGKRPGADPVTGKRTLIRESSGFWVHIVMGPIFLILSILFLAAGFDLVGLPGTNTLDYVLNAGNKLAPRAVTYDKRYTFRFPIFERSCKKFGQNASTVQIPEPRDQKLINTP